MFCTRNAKALMNVSLERVLSATDARRTNNFYDFCASSENGSSYVLRRPRRVLCDSSRGRTMLTALPGSSPSELRSPGRWATELAESLKRDADGQTEFLLRALLYVLNGVIDLPRHNAPLNAAAPSYRDHLSRDARGLPKGS